MNGKHLAIGVFAILISIAPRDVHSQEVQKLEGESQIEGSEPSGQGDPRKLRWFGDFRLRLEQDWDSLQGDGTERDDRLRLRIRLRGGVAYSPTDRWRFRVQARTGPKLAQQSPHVTVYDFDDGPDGPYEANFDYWLVGYAAGGFEAWAGRNELSMWHQDDLFIFDNVTYTGAGGSFRHDFSEWRSLSLNANYVALPAGMRDNSGTAFIGQIAYDCDFEGSGFTVAAGYWDSSADPDEPAGELLLTENNSRDYQVIDFQLQYRTRLFRGPFRVGYDYLHNLEDYSKEPEDSFSELHQDDRDGYVIEALWGQDKEAGDWLLGYYYTNLEALSVHSSYIADDWVRWGNANQVRATNLKGSEFRVIYTLNKRMNLFMRVFFVDAIRLLEPQDTTLETGNRFRLDWNVKF